MFESCWGPGGDTKWWFKHESNVARHDTSTESRGHWGKGKEQNVNPQRDSNVRLRSTEEFGSWIDGGRLHSSSFKFDSRKQCSSLLLSRLLTTVQCSTLHWDPHPKCLSKGWYMKGRWLAFNVWSVVVRYVIFSLPGCVMTEVSNKIHHHDSSAIILGTSNGNTLWVISHISHSSFQTWLAQCGCSGTWALHSVLSGF